VGPSEGARSERSSRRCRKKFERRSAPRDFMEKLLKKIRHINVGKSVAALRCVSGSWPKRLGGEWGSVLSQTTHCTKKRGTQLLPDPSSCTYL